MGAQGMGGAEVAPALRGGAVTAQDIADRYWQHAATSHRLDKALSLATRFNVPADAVLEAIPQANAARVQPPAKGSGRARKK